MTRLDCEEALKIVLNIHQSFRVKMKCLEQRVVTAAVVNHDAEKNIST